LPGVDGDGGGLGVDDCVQEGRVRVVGQRVQGDAVDGRQGEGVQPGHVEKPVAADDAGNIGTSRVARWYVYFLTKNPNFGEFGKVLQSKMLVFLGPFCLFYGQMVYFMAIWFILLSFGIFSPVLVCCNKKNWQP
jgi:hypothetical protein